jgi:hypothetical protein
MCTVPSNANCYDAKVARPRAVVIEDNPLTLWAIRRTLTPTFDLVCCSTFKEARIQLSLPNVSVVICGSPVAEDHPEWIERISRIPGLRVVALMARPLGSLPKSVTVLEKPFELAELLAEAKLGQGPAGGQASSPRPVRSGPAVPLRPLADRLRDRFEQEICKVCVHRTADGGCSMKQEHRWEQCPVYQWAGQLAQLVEGVRSVRLAEYMDRIAAIICPQCRQLADGGCETRDHLDCPLDLYLGLIVPIIEEELARAAPPR